MKKILYTLLLLGIMAPAIAQEQLVTGRVIDSQGEPIEAAVVIMIAGESASGQSSAVSTTDGTFSMAQSSLPFTLLVEHLAFESVEKEFATAQVGDIILATKNLAMDEVTVKTHRPIVKAEEGKLSYNMSQIAAGTTATNVYEAIEKLPGVVLKDGVLELLGAGTVTVIINGKPTSMTSEQLEAVLSSMPIERIKSAEVMYSAPPQYGVRGAAINLVISRSQDYSYSGEVHTKYKYQRQGSWNSGGSFALSTPKWSADATYNYNDKYFTQVIETTSNHTIGSDLYTINQLGDVQSRTDSHSVRAALDYTPSDKRSLSVVYNTTLTPYENMYSLSEGSYVNSISDAVHEIALHNIAIRYRTQSGFDIGADYSHYSKDQTTRLENIYSDNSESSFNTTSGQDISRLNLFVDMKHQVAGGWSISYGAKGSWAQDDYFQHYTDLEGEIESYDSDSTSSEISTEAYLGTSRNLSKGSLSASLSAEYYNFDGDERFTLYPQANFVWMFDQSNIVQANLSSNKVYPSYWMMQGAISYVDGYTEIHGNPDLSPMRNYSLQLSYILSQRYVVTLFGNHIRDYYVQNAYQDPDRLALIYKNINFEFANQYGVNVALPFSVGKTLSSRLTMVGSIMQHRCDDFYGISFNRTALFGYASLDNTIAIGKNISLEVNALRHSSSIQGTFDIEGAWGLDAGVKVSLMEKKLSLTAKCNDIFNSRVPPIYVDYEGQNIEMYTGKYNRNFIINAAYRFGDYTQKERKEVDTSRF